MSGSSSKRARKRSTSPCDCDFDDPVREAIENKIKQLPKILLDEERTSALLRRVKEDAMHLKGRLEGDVADLRFDLRRQQKHSESVGIRYAHLMLRISETYPELSIW